ncbi:TPA: helix-turn-helix domain-containing protein [Vibrio parahaemolyticus]|nr:helix-turn-helix domain-containing protein [Vibrio parahaemolyticus]
MKVIRIAMINYPTASQSALYGFLEAMTLANVIIKKESQSVFYEVEVITLENLDLSSQVDVVIIPPCINDDFCIKCDEQYQLNDYLKEMQRHGAVLASACVGAFILARGGFLDNKFCTTHWRLRDTFKQSFPKVKLNENAILINEGNVITAGGRMAWVDLLFEIISLYSSPAISMLLSKELVIDVGSREQRFYQQFIPKLDHGDELVSKIQQYLDEHYSHLVTVSELAELFFVSTRTLQRRFNQALGLTIVQYLQQLRLHHACKHLEMTKQGVAEIAYLVGYQDVSAFRRLFTSRYGLSPTEFRKRFSRLS